jgi:hypothetical protein
LKIKFPSHELWGTHSHHSTFSTGKCVISSQWRNWINNGFKSRTAGGWSPILSHVPLSDYIPSVRCYQTLLTTLQKYNGIAIVVPHFSKHWGLWLNICCCTFFSISLDDPGHLSYTHTLCLSSLAESCLSISELAD